MCDSTAQRPHGCHLIWMLNRDQRQPIRIVAVTLQGGPQGKRATGQGAVRDREALNFGATAHGHVDHGFNLGRDGT
ncbi:hypothetical protein D3C80_2183810 [compost metagenome]